MPLIEPLSNLSLGKVLISRKLEKVLRGWSGTSNSFTNVIRSFSTASISAGSAQKTTASDNFTPVLLRYRCRQPNAGLPDWGILSVVNFLPCRTVDHVRFLVSETTLSIGQLSLLPHYQISQLTSGYSAIFLSMSWLVWWPAFDQR